MQSLFSIIAPSSTSTGVCTAKSTQRRGEGGVEEDRSPLTARTKSPPEPQSHTPTPKPQRWASTATVKHHGASRQASPQEQGFEALAEQERKEKEEERNRKRNRSRDRKRKVRG
ncbi:hypothetical protein AGOR_G00057680 [Albula goreensis]|uniref:Uncharacterized protein n=1 Tax=Albula goreensis TaxID=1534307 RepID=A0A8T3E3K3_9TELE|nr:hypothetical protein AGOR_G00057680 [Albula goreensis]